MSATSQIQKVNVLRQYLVYVVSFVGAGMVSGGVVHYPLNENYYGALAVLGGIVFAVGSIANEVLSNKGFPKLRCLLAIISISLLLSFGIGMLSGGIQHFTDFPSRSAVLIPSGIVLSYLAFCLKAGWFQRPSIKKVLTSGILVTSVALASLAVLMNVADGMNTPAHTHDHSEVGPLTHNPSEVGPSNPAEDHSKHPHNK